MDSLKGPFRHSQTCGSNFFSKNPINRKIKNQKRRSNHRHPTLALHVFTVPKPLVSLEKDMNKISNQLQRFFSLLYSEDLTFYRRFEYSRVKYAEEINFEL